VRGLLPWFLDGLKNAFTANVGLKLFSLGASIGIFVLVHGAEDAQRSIFVDVVAILPPEDSGRILVSELPDRVRVTLQGSRSLLNSIRREEMEPVQVDLAESDLRYYYFEPASFDLPVGVTVVQLAPASIPLTWADRAERELAVNARVRGEPGLGLSLRRPVVVTPAEVTLLGAESELDALSAVDTETIDVRGLEPGVHERIVRLERPPPHAVYRGDGTVSVRIEIVPERDDRLLTDLTVEAVGPLARIRPATVDVTLRGAPEQVARVQPGRIVPFVDSSVAELAAGGMRPLQVQVRGIPEGIEVVSIDPAEVLVGRTSGGGTAGAAAGAQ
jgi:YbbR domain-containing protein